MAIPADVICSARLRDGVVERELTGKAKCRHGDKIGNEYNDLRVLEFVGYFQSGTMQAIVVRTQCLLCQSQSLMILGNVINGHTKRCTRCGRLSAASKIADANRSHGLSHTALYKRWRQLGEKGRLCSEWRDSFELFADSLDDLPGNGDYLSEIDPRLPIGPGNAMWAWGHRLPTSTIVEVDGVPRTMSEIARLTGVSRQNVDQQNRKGRLVSWLIDRGHKAIMICDGRGVVR